jgi:hypothetical protein
MKPWPLNQLTLILTRHHSKTVAPSPSPLSGSLSLTSIPLFAKHNWRPFWPRCAAHGPYPSVPASACGARALPRCPCTGVWLLGPAMASQRRVGPTISGMWRPGNAWGGQLPHDDVREQVMPR